MTVIIEHRMAHERRMCVVHFLHTYAGFRHRALMQEFVQLWKRLRLMKRRRNHWRWHGAPYLQGGGYEGAIQVDHSVPGGIRQNAD